MEALQSAMEEAEQSEGVPDSQALPVLTSGSASEDSPRSPVLCLKGDEDQVCTLIRLMHPAELGL